MQTKINTDMKRGNYRSQYAGFMKGNRINKLSLNAEAWFWRVHSVADDFGNLDGNPILVFSGTVGLRFNTVSVAQVGEWIQEMISVCLLREYEVKGDRYLHIPGFTEMQPAGKNGRRVHRVPDSPWDELTEYENPVNPGESGKIQNIPEESGISQPAKNKTNTNTKNKNNDGADYPDSPNEIPSDAIPISDLIPRFNSWSVATEGVPADPVHNVAAPVQALILAASQQMPICQGDSMVRADKLIPLAIENLQKSGTNFKSIKYATAAVKNRLAEWAKHGLPGAKQSRDAPPPIRRDPAGTSTKHAS